MVTRLEQTNNIKVILNLKEHPSVDVSATVIRDACENFFSKICKNVPGKFYSGRRELHPIRQDARKVVKAIKHLYPDLYSSESVRKLRDFARCPELTEAFLALQKGIKPKKVDIGNSGTYFVLDRQKRPIGVFKPKDQEAGTEGNRKGIIGPIRGVEVGKCYQRERVAYLLDRHHFARVPKTVIARLPRSYFEEQTARKPELTKGSFQRFVPSAIHARGNPISTEDLQRTAVLDFRILNQDRHLKNLLLDKKGRARPIDHGFALQLDALDLRFEWLDYSQTKEPFSKKILAYIEKIDTEKDLKLIQRRIPTITKSNLLRFKFASLLLKKAAKRGWTPHQIGTLMINRFESHIFDPSKTSDAEIDRHLEKILTNSLH